MRNQKLRKNSLFTIALLALSTLFVACSQDDNNIENLDGKGRLTVNITDAPFPIDIVDKTVVTIDRLSIGSAAKGEEEGNFLVLSEEEREIDLLDLTHGVTLELASVDIDAGTYDEIRLHVVDAKVLLKDGTEFDLKIPSGSSSGLKIKIAPAVTIEEGLESTVLLDFDVSKSFVMQGNMNTPAGIKGFLFKPVIRCVFEGFTGQIEGTVTDTSAVVLPNALVKVWNLTPEMEPDTVVTSGFTNETGYYKIIGLPEGTYHLTGELENYEPLLIEEVAVESKVTTTVDFELTPVEPEAPAEETGE
ncbi:DUF4382 domain-containing protein [uncultured Sunxiuqinia sp.]|uniref:DUF4382 domain-containing protein n=1 Tax=uncultured Sunxiuqinia sp. TaxID=1573825 RepID=UPI002607AEF6|nr:DUF4382 domain-containing protein [uncultured Sunxiuqinia sp.]